MFNDARIKLTGWYVLILVSVCLLLSTIIYQYMVNEVIRLERLQRVRLEQRIVEYGNPGFGLRLGQLPINQELINEARDRALFALAWINGVILVVGGVMSYWLAGRTLAPIELMHNKQRQFVVDASHELKTPLTSLKTGFEVFLRSNNPTVAGAKSLASDGLIEVDRLQTMAESLVLLARDEVIDGTKPALLNKTVEAAVRRISRLAKKNEVAIEMDLSDTKTTVDNDLGERLWLILLDNAVKYSKNNGKVLVITQKRAGRSWVIVEDNGLGIESKDLPHIFDRFYRSDRARSRKTGGYGLGLAIAKQIVDRLGGDITVESVVGKWTRFSVEL